MNHQGTDYQAIAKIIAPWQGLPAATRDMERWRVVAPCGTEWLMDAGLAVAVDLEQHGMTVTVERPMSATRQQNAWSQGGYIGVN